VADAALTRVAWGVVVAEAAVLLVAGAVLLVGFRDSYGIGTGVTSLILGGFVAWLARALRAGSTWARTPVVFIQLLALPVGIGFLQVGNVAIGVVALVVAVATGLAVLAS
jgi:hypothetical protein